MDDKHPIDFGGLLKVATEWALPLVDMGMWVYRSNLAKGGLSRTKQGIGVWGCSCLSHCLVVVVAGLTWRFHWILRTKLASLIDSLQ